MKTLSVKVLAEKVFISYPEQCQNSSLWLVRTQLYLYICLRWLKDTVCKPIQDLRPSAISLGYADPGAISLESCRAATNNRPTQANLLSRRLNKRRCHPLVFRFDAGNLLVYLFGRSVAHQGFQTGAQ